MSFAEFHGLFEMLFGRNFMIDTRHYIHSMFRKTLIGKGTKGWAIEYILGKENIGWRLEFFRRMLWDDCVELGQLGSSYEYFLKIGETNNASSSDKSKRSISYD